MAPSAGTSCPMSPPSPPAFQPRVRVNGLPAAAVPVMDRGLMYGDGVFRTLRAEQGRVAAWTRHYRKLVADCAALGITPPGREALEADIEALLAGQDSAVLKIIVTRGEGGRGYGPGDTTHATRIVMATPLPAHPARFREEGVRLHLCRLRLARQPRLAGVKHLNRLENVLARMEWSDPEIPEGLLRDEAGHVIEGTMSNLFLRTGDRLITPELSQCGVAGVQRERILAVAPALGLRPEVATLSLETLLAAEEVLVCNSVIGVWPVRALEGHVWPVGGLAALVERALESLDD